MIKMAHLHEKQLDSTVLYKGKIIQVEKDNVRLEDGTQAVREVVRHPGGVCVLAVTDENEVLLVKQFRYPHGIVTIEIPAGKLEYGENPEECGRRELLEECGCRAREFTSMGRIFPTPAYDTEVIYIYLAKGLEYAGQNLDAGEFLDVEKIPFEEALRNVLADAYPDAKTQTAILKYYAMMQKKGTA